MGNEGMGKVLLISVIIPVHNAEKTIGTCLRSVIASGHGNFEVLVVDDHSDDGSSEIIKGFPVKLIRLPQHGGASRARNAGARSAKGDALFFVDADCVLQQDTLEAAARAYRAHGDAVVGGTYTPVPYDPGFFSTFQSVFINFSETKNRTPDYIATHAMLIGRELFLRHGGFREEFLPILEDVEFSHRLRREGVKLVMDRSIKVRHIFNFTLARSLRNAFRKSMYWTMYSLRNKDLFADSGTASLELKSNTVCWGICLSFLLLFIISGSTILLAALAAVCALNLSVNRHFIKALFATGGPAFGVGAVFYYTALYPAAVGAGGLMGLVRRR